MFIGETQVYRLNCQTWEIEAIESSGDNPGWIYEHQCRFIEPGLLVAWTEEAIHRHVPNFEEAYRNRDWARVLESTGDFTFLSHHSILHTVTMSKKRYLELWRSHNRLNNTAGSDRFASFFNELQSFLDKRQLRQIDVLYRCEAWLARRND